MSENIMYKNIADKMKQSERNNEIRRRYLQLIIDIGYDYDGLNTNNELKTLIYELVRYAKLGVNLNDKETIFVNNNIQYNILGEKIGEDNE